MTWTKHIGIGDRTEPGAGPASELLGDQLTAQEAKSQVVDSPMGAQIGVNDEVSQRGALIINADDWGRNNQATDRTLGCILRRAVSSVSAMVFMEDSERAAAIARSKGIDAGLHLNFTTPFSAPNVPASVVERQRELAAHLRRHRLAQGVFNPWLTRSFQYVLNAQVDEFCRLYGAKPERLDGHHHMHLCANVLLGGLLPPGVVVRRSFSFRAGEKGVANRYYRRAVDYLLARHHKITDFFFSLAPLEPRNRLQQMFSLARHHVVEVETHPFNPEEYRFLADGEIFHCVRHLPISPYFVELLNGNTTH